MDKDLIYNLKKPRKDKRDKKFYEECFQQLRKPEYSKIFKELVNSILEEYKKPYIKVTQLKDINRLRQIVKALLDTEKITNYQYNNFIRDLDDDTNFLYLYDDNGNWSPLNKLNTNYYANARLFSRVLRYSKIYDSDRVLTELKRGFTDGLEYIVNELENFPEAKASIFQNFIKNDKKLIEIIENTSNVGDLIEDQVMCELKEHGWKVYYHGGSGDLIDQRLGIDIIIRKKKEIKTVQVKTVSKIEKNGEGFKITGKFTRPYSTIDLFCFGTKNNEIIVTDKEVEKLNDSYQFQIKNPIIVKQKDNT